MFRLLSGVVAAAAVLACPAPGSPGGGSKAARVAAEEFVFTSVRAGLRDDGVPPALAVRLTENPDFVPKCPLCAATLKALKEYGRLATAPAPKAGCGLDPRLAARLTSTEAGVRHAALRDLVAGYMDRGYAGANLTAAERGDLERRVKEMRMVPKDPAAGFGNGLKFCPSCDGACRVRPEVNE
jgi:hypothetical protein